MYLYQELNTVEGLTDTHIEKWGWKVNEKGWVNWPDYQTRIYRNTEDVTWMNKVHERITGYDTFSNFPAEEQWCLYHPKQIDRQEKQNQFYENDMKLKDYYKMYLTLHQNKNCIRLHFFRTMGNFDKYLFDILSLVVVSYTNYTIYHLSICMEWTLSF